MLSIHHPISVTEVSVAGVPPVSTQTPSNSSPPPFVPSSSPNSSSACTTSSAISPVTTVPTANRIHSQHPYLQQLHQVRRFNQNHQPPKQSLDLPSPSNSVTSFSDQEVATQNHHQQQQSSGSNASTPTPAAMNAGSSGGVPATVTTTVSNGAPNRTLLRERALAQVALNFPPTRNGLKSTSSPSPASPSFMKVPLGGAGGKGIRNSSMGSIASGTGSTSSGGSVGAMNGNPKHKVVFDLHLSNIALFGAQSPQNGVNSLLVQQRRGRKSNPSSPPQPISPSDFPAPLLHQDSYERGNLKFRLRLRINPPNGLCFIIDGGTHEVVLPFSDIEWFGSHAFPKDPVYSSPLSVSPAYSSSSLSLPPAISLSESEMLRSARSSFHSQASSSTSSSSIAGVGGLPTPPLSATYSSTSGESGGSSSTSFEDSLLKNSSSSAEEMMKVMSDGMGNGPNGKNKKVSASTKENSSGEDENSSGEGGPLSDKMVVFEMGVRISGNGPGGQGGGKKKEWLAGGSGQKHLRIRHPNKYLPAPFDFTDGVIDKTRVIRMVVHGSVSEQLAGGVSDMVIRELAGRDKHASLFPKNNLSPTPPTSNKSTLFVSSSSNLVPRPSPLPPPLLDAFRNINSRTASNASLPHSGGGSGNSCSSRSSMVMPITPPRTPIREEISDNTPSNGPSSFVDSNKATQMAPLFSGGGGHDGITISRPASSQSSLFAASRAVGHNRKKGPPAPLRISTVPQPRHDGQGNVTSTLPPHLTRFFEGLASAGAELEQAGNRNNFDPFESTFGSDPSVIHRTPTFDPFNYSYRNSGMVSSAPASAVRGSFENNASTDASQLSSPLLPQTYLSSHFSRQEMILAAAKLAAAQKEQQQQLHHAQLRRHHQQQQQQQEISFEPGYGLSGRGGGNQNNVYESFGPGCGLLAPTVHHHQQQRGSHQQQRDQQSLSPTSPAHSTTSYPDGAIRASGMVGVPASITSRKSFDSIPSQQHHQQQQSQPTRNNIKHVVSFDRAVGSSRPPPPLSSPYHDEFQQAQAAEDVVERVVASLYESDEDYLVGSPGWNNAAPLSPSGGVGVGVGIGGHYGNGMDVKSIWA